MIIEHGFSRLVEAKKFTEENISTIKEEIEEKILTKDLGDLSQQFCIIMNGSYARNEASECSDLDYYILTRDSVSDEQKSQLQDLVKDIVNETIQKKVGATGTFETVVTESELNTNVGGQHDKNQTLTRRLLLLLEGKSLFNDELFNQVRNTLIDGVYVKPCIKNESICRFLLNDVIRYYRTMATDYEFKISEQKKSWGVRNVKLRFSRKFLYFGGIIMSAETYSLDRESKVEKLKELIAMSPIERLCYVSTTDVTKAICRDILRDYEWFLNEISLSNVRESLDVIKRESRDVSKEFCDFRDKAKDFSENLEKWLKEKYQFDHPIHWSLIF